MFQDVGREVLEDADERHAVGGDDDGRGMIGAEPLEELLPREPGEHEVEKDEVVLRGSHAAQCFRSGIRAVRRMTVLGELLGDHGVDVVMILDYEDMCHVTTPSWARPAAPSWHRRGCGWL